MEALRLSEFIERFIKEFSYIEKKALLSFLAKKNPDNADRMLKYIADESFLDARLATAISATLLGPVYTGSIVKQSYDGWFNEFVEAIK